MALAAPKRVKKREVEKYVDMEIKDLKRGDVFKDDSGESWLAISDPIQEHEEWTILCKQLSEETKKLFYRKKEV